MPDAKFRGTWGTPYPFCYQLFAGFLRHDPQGLQSLLCGISHCQVGFRASDLKRNQKGVGWVRSRTDEKCYTQTKIAALLKASRERTSVGPFLIPKYLK